MLVGRFLYIIPLLAVAGSLAAKKRIPVTSGTLPTHGPLFVGLLVGTVVIVSALTFFPGAIAESDCRAFPDAPGKVVLAMRYRLSTESLLDSAKKAWIDGPCCRKRLAHSRPLFDPEILGRAIKDSFVKLNPGDADEESGDVRGGGGRGGTTILLNARHCSGARRNRLHAADRDMAVVHGVVCELRGGHGGGRGKAQADALRKTKTDAMAKAGSNGKMEQVPASRLRAGRHGVLRSRRYYSRRRRSD